VGPNPAGHAKFFEQEACGLAGLVLSNSLDNPVTADRVMNGKASYSNIRFRLAIHLRAANEPGAFEKAKILHCHP
jgi:hypothetical protein